MGGLRVHDLHEPNSSTPKLSLPKLPSKPREPIQMLTPPLHQTLSIPFRWEVAPGKARAVDTCTLPPKTAARRLDLPPRLLNDDSLMGSPVTELVCTFSFRKGEGGARPVKKRGSFREVSRHSLSEAFKNEKKITRLKRRSFFDLSAVNTDIWADIYASFKHAVPWRWRR